MSSDNSSLLKPYSLTGRDVYDFYRQNRKKMAKGIDQYNYFVKAVDGIFMVIKEMMLQSEGGVHIAGLGYFCNLKNPREFSRKVKVKNSLIKKKKNYYSYHPLFIPDPEMKMWSMDYTFKESYITELQNSKLEYKLHFNLVNSIRNAEEFAIKKKNHRKVRGEYNYNSSLIQNLD